MKLMQKTFEDNYHVVVSPNMTTSEYLAWLLWQSAWGTAVSEAINECEKQLETKPLVERLVDLKGL